MKEERLIAIDTCKSDKTLKWNEMRLTFSGGRSEVTDITDPKNLGRTFNVGMEKTDVN